MRHTTKQLIAAALMLTVAVTPVQAAAPAQFNPNTVVPVGIDPTTANATSPYIDHTTGSIFVTQATPSGVAVNSTGPTGASSPTAATLIGGSDSTGNLQVPRMSPYAGEYALVVDNVANGTSGASAPAQVGVVAGLDSSSNIRPMLTSTSGVPYVITESIKASYRASASDVAPAASATDVTTLCGSATKTVRVNRVAVTADATNAGVIDFYLFKRTAADTGGATSSVAVGQMDSNDPASTATVLKYTANPATLGTGVLIASDHYALPAAASTGIPVFIWSEDFGTRNNETLVLRGVAQCLAVNLNGQAVPAGMNMYVNYGWTEE